MASKSVFDDVAAGVGAVGSIVGGIGSFFGGKSQAKAAESEAQAQLQISQEQLQAAQQARQTAVSLAQPTTQQLVENGQLLTNQMNAITQQTQALNQDYSLLKSAAPSIQAAGEEAYQILQGQSTPLTQAIQSQYALGRTKLEASLASAYGPDYATSSIGSNQLQQYDINSAASLAGVTNQTLGTLLGTAETGYNLGTSNMGMENSNVNNASSLYTGTLQGQNNLIVNAFTGNPTNQASNNLVASAGNSQIGGILEGQNLGNVFNGIGQLGSTALGYTMLGNALNNNTTTTQPTIGEQVLPSSFNPYSNPGAYGPYNPSNYSLNPAINTTSAGY